MPTITDWLMVAITLIYVIATIFICIANLKSAKATRDQLTEMRREHDENVRLSIMPYFEVNCNRPDPEIHKISSEIYFFSGYREFMKKESKYKMGASFLNLKNNGVNLAISICIKIEYKGNKIGTIDLVNLAIRPGEEYCLRIGSFIPPSELDDSNYTYFDNNRGRTHKTKKAKIILEFNDIQNNRYLQIAHISFTLTDIYKEFAIFLPDKTRGDDCSIGIQNCFTEPPVLVKRVSNV